MPGRERVLVHASSEVIDLDTMAEKPVVESATLRRLNVLEVIKAAPESGGNT